MLVAVFDTRVVVTYLYQIIYRMIYIVDLLHTKKRILVVLILTVGLSLELGISRRARQVEYD